MERFIDNLFLVVSHLDRPEIANDEKVIEWANDLFKGNSLVEVLKKIAAGCKRAVSSESVHTCESNVESELEEILKSMHNANLKNLQHGYSEEALVLLNKCIAANCIKNLTA